MLVVDQLQMKFSKMYLTGCQNRAHKIRLANQSMKKVQDELEKLECQDGEKGVSLSPGSKVG